MVWFVGVCVPVGSAQGNACIEYSIRTATMRAGTCVPRFEGLGLGFRVKDWV